MNHSRRQRLEVGRTGSGRGAGGPRECKNPQWIFHLYSQTQAQLNHGVHRRCWSPVKKGKNVITTKCRIVRGELDRQAGGLKSWQGAHSGFWPYNCLLVLCTFLFCVTNHSFMTKQQLTILQKDLRRNSQQE